MAYRDKFTFFISLYNICRAYFVELSFCDYLCGDTTIKSVFDYVRRNS
ncbi:hypothetical protein HMPREF2533_01331 [Bacteroides fragilis]|nr:hypothetical protein HMPREF2530_01331 [Bacteroides fragilis]KXU48221.1 hypothetical protein HMPREF2533_01331 [Bacteroides fragilis]